MNENNPLVSVLMTAYNREKYIAGAIESVLDSSYTDFELLVVDDGSKDTTVEIVKQFLVKDDRIRLYLNEKNLGDYPNRNKAVSLARGTFVMFCDSDDMFLKDTIEKVSKIVKEYPDVNFGMYSEHSNEVNMLQSKEALYKHFFSQQFLYVGPGGTFIRRSFFNNIGHYPEKYGPANDMYFNLNAACHSGVLIFPFKPIFYRQHEGQEINNRFSYMYNNYRYLRDALNELPLPFTEKEIKWLKNKNKRRFTVHLFNFFYKTKDLKKTKEAYIKADFSVKFILQGIFHTS